MYQVYCDQYQLYDPRSDKLNLLSAKCNLEANTVCEGSLTILHNHPFYDKLKPLKSVFEIKRDRHTLFRGRMTNNSRDFNKCLQVDLEGVLAFANDTIIPPFILKDGKLTRIDQPDAVVSGNVVQFFLTWILDQHNKYVKDWQKLKIGTVTVTSPDGDFTRTSEDYKTTWEILKTMLFESSLGGYLYVRYEDDGNYVDYVTQFEYTNIQRMKIGANILDINTSSDTDTTYSVILPMGASVEETITSEDETYEGMYVTIHGSKTMKVPITLDSLPDGNLTDDLVKLGKYIYSKSAVEEYGWVCVPPSDAINDDIVDVGDLRDWAMAYLSGTASKYSNTIVITAIDLSLTDEQIASIRPYQNVIVDAPTYGFDGTVYPLPKMEIDILNPQNTVVTIGDTTRSLVDINRQQMTNTQETVGEIRHEIQASKEETLEKVNEQSITQRTEVVETCSNITMTALKSYVEKSEFGKYQEKVSTDFGIYSDEIKMQFNKVTDSVTNVNGNMQSKFEEVYKYIRFKDGNITLGSNENAITLTIENDMIVFKKNNVQFGWWDGVDFHTGNIVVNVDERAQLGNFAFVPRSDGSLMFLKVND